jgi:hypothetical protein
MTKLDVIIDNFHANLDDLLDVQDNNQQQALENLVITYKFRHDLVHHVFCVMLGMDDKLRRERRIDDILIDVKFANGKLSPDIVVFQTQDGEYCNTLDECYFIRIIDFSSSSRSNQQAIEKQRKYGGLVQEICDQLPAKETSMHVCSVKPDYSDIDVRFFDLCKYLSKDVDVEDAFLRMRLFADKLRIAQDKLKGQIQDERLIKQYFEREFSDQDQDMTQNIINADAELFDRIENAYERNKENCTRNKILLEHEEWVMNKVRANAAMKHDESREHHTKMFEQQCEMLDKIITDPDIIEAFKEKETSIEKIQDSITKLKIQTDTFPEQKSKPIHQLFTPIWSKKKKIDLKDVVSIDKSLLNKLRLEQQQILMMLSLFKDSSAPAHAVKFIKEIANEMLTSFSGDFGNFNIEMFNTGNYISESDEEEWRSKYNTYRSDCKIYKTPIRGFVEYLKDNGESVPKMQETRSYRQKMFRIPLINRSDEFVAFWEKSHSGFKKDRKVSVEDRASCRLEDSEEVDALLDFLSEKVEFNPGHEDLYQSFFSKLPSKDEPVLQDLKDKMVNEFKPLMRELRNFKGYHYLLAQSLFAEQLMHFNQFTLPSNTMSFFTCGHNNILYVMNNSYHDQGKDVGKAFMVIGFTDDDRWFMNPLGKITRWKQRLGDKDVWMFCTEWRRIETYKVTFVKDQFFCILSTAMNGLLRNRSMILDYDHIEDKDSYSREIVRHHFVLKVVIGLTTNQRIAEMLADMRYAIMASFSEYSEIERLIMDKFSPPYNTSMEAWIASRMRNLKRQAHDFIKEGIRRTYFKQPVFYNGQRSEDSIGGKFDIPSIWTGHIIHDLQDLLDDMFIYVHTLKEPSSIHHENVKAVNTILEYQNKYETMTKDRKCGYARFDGLKEMLLDPLNNIGHNSNILEVSVSKTMDSIKGVDWESRFKKHFSEPISNITSTKAAIPEYERELVDETGTDLDTMTKKKRNKKIKIQLQKSLFIQEYAKYSNANAKERPIKMLRTKISRESSLPNKNRSKVHDCILDVIEQNNYISTVFDMAEWNITKNNSKTLADICIKAQYGAKREFYVINVGSKSCARVLENMFEEICKELPNEMISVPGDKKLLKMQEFINQALSKKGTKDRIFFVNGDCTKWSAAETMECFMSMLRGLSSYVPLPFIKYMSSVILMWGNKDITIPISLLQNTFFTTEDKTKYLETHKATLNSDQNFLQGMFNYMSSFKAVCSSNYTRDVWKAIRPNSKIKMEHMEHSDDYSLIITTQSMKELEELRILHRVLMKCHGFNDSVKKTNTQQFLMEFISLVSLNGHMTYPHIKKLKECGMNLGCTGYRDDIDGAMSRVGEAVRVGSILTSAYFMQRCHIANVCRSYSILEGQRNNIAPLKTLCNTPVEMFGIPDTHPIFSLLCKGLTNNYRLFKYASDYEGVYTIKNESFQVKIKTMMKNLLEMELQNNEETQSAINEDFTEGNRLFHPRYTFDQENKLIKKIRSKVKMSFEDNLKFWEEHKTYNFLKPKNRFLLIDWMRAMYFRHSFALAYSRNSRAQITLRLSTYTSKECCVIGTDEDGVDKFDSILNYTRKFFTNGLPHKYSEQTNITESEWLEVEKSAMNSDSTVSSIYSFFRESRILPGGVHSRMTVSTLTPPKINWLNIDNSAGALTQYIFNFQDFQKDMREHKGLPSLSADRMIIEKYYKQELNSETNLSTIKSVFTDINLSKDRRNLCMSYSNNPKTLEDFLKTHLDYGSIYKHRIQIHTSGVKEAINPHSGEKYYRKMRSTTKNPYRALIDDSALLYSVLRHSCTIDIDEIRNILDSLEIQDINNQNSDPFKYKELVQLNIQDLKTLEFTTMELKTFAFMKAFSLQDSSDLTKLASDNLMFSYQYVKLVGDDSDLFSECVLFEYQRCQFRSLRIRGTNQIIVEVDAPRKHLLTDAYLISQKLFGIITQSVLEKTISTVTLRSLLETKNLKNLIDIFDDTQRTEYRRKSGAVSSLKKDPKTGHFSFAPIDGDESYCTPFFFVGEIDEPTITQKEPINKRITIEWDQNSVHVGNKKLFTLPILGCQQSNMSYTILNPNINGLDVNWWLKESRLKDFVHEDEIKITRDVFERIGSYKLGKESFILSLSSARNFEKLVNLPSIKLFLDQSASIDRLKDRIKNTRQSISDVENANKKRVELEKERLIQQELDEMSSLKKDSSKINWNDAFKSMGNVPKEFDAILGNSLTEPKEDIQEEITEMKPIKLTFDFGSMGDSDDEDDDMGGMQFNFEKEFTEEDLGYQPIVPINEDDMVENTEGELNNDVLARLINEELGGFADMSIMKVIDHNVDSDDEDFERENIKEGSDESSNGKSNEQYLAFAEFQNMVPKIEAKDVIFTSGVSHSTQKLRRLGEPTQYIIKNNFIDRSSISMVKPKDRVGILYRLKAMLELADFMSDHELFISLTLLSTILQSFEDRPEWSLTRDYVLTKTSEDALEVFVKFQGSLPDESRKKIASNGGKVVTANGESIYYIPLLPDRKKEYLESLTEENDMHRFANIKPLEDCYMRMYHEPFRRIGLASILISELM